jgi:hypothetical protein
MKKVCRDDIPLTELLEEIDFLANEYEKSLRRHRLKFKISTMKAAITAPLALVENVVKLRLKSLLEAPFSVTEAYFSMQEAERNAPGRELSYLIRANQAFSRRRSTRG